MNTSQLHALIVELSALPRETEWVEFKQNKADGEMIGNTISAIANSSALHGKASGFLVWGVEDQTHRIVGTKFRPEETKVGNEELENWLLTQLDPRIDIQIHEGDFDANRVVIFEIQPAKNRPVGFRGVEYIRIGTYVKKLREYPEMERKLWKLFDRIVFEQGAAKADATADEVLSLIDYPEYHHLMQLPLSENRAAILERLEQEKIIRSNTKETYEISNIGAILFARNLDKFDRLSRKALRVIIYDGPNRTKTLKEQKGVKGYAIGFSGAINYINDQLPSNEEIGRAFRKEHRMYPEIAIRELVVNALIHQDFSITGAGPTVEIFSDRIEITNPGVPLIDTLRFIDEPPRSRNEQLAGLMRRMGICEERGSGIDKVIYSVEECQLPAPDFRVTLDSTVAVLYGPRDFSQMDKGERVRACYQHACLQFVSGKRMTNATLRTRLGIKDSSYTIASRIIRDSIETGLVKPYGDEGISKKTTSYVPFWA